VVVAVVVVVTVAVVVVVEVADGVDVVVVVDVADGVDVVVVVDVADGLLGRLAWPEPLPVLLAEPGGVLAGRGAVVGVGLLAGGDEVS
jgi:hypothetical protein